MRAFLLFLALIGIWYRPGRVRVFAQVDASSAGILAYCCGSAAVRRIRCGGLSRIRHAKLSGDQSKYSGALANVGASLLIK